MTKKHKTNEQLTTTNVKTIKPLNKKKYICVCCDFECSQKCDINNHLMTKKHLTNEQLTAIVDKESQKNYTCKCGKAYKHMSSLCKHKRTCIIEEEPEKNNEIINLLIENNKQLQENNKQLQDDNKEIKNIIIQQNAAILELTKNGINNNNTTNNTKIFNIQIYLNETCKDAVNIEDFVKNITITNEDLLTYAEYDFGKATTDIIVKNLKPLKNNNFPFHCSNIQDKTIYTKSLNSWLRDEGELFQKMVINGIQRKLMVQFLSYRNEYPECKKSSSHLSNKYNKFTVSINSNYEKIFNNKILLNVIKNIVIPK
jgi:hypothetical protein